MSTCCLRAKAVTSITRAQHGANLVPRDVRSLDYTPCTHGAVFWRPERLCVWPFKVPRMPSWALVGLHHLAPGSWKASKLPWIQYKAWLNCPWGEISPRGRRCQLWLASSQSQGRLGTEAGRCTKAGSVQPPKVTSCLVMGHRDIMCLPDTGNYNKSLPIHSPPLGVRAPQTPP